MASRFLSAILPVLLALLSLAAIACKPASLPLHSTPAIQEDFNSGDLGRPRWAPTRSGDFAEMAVDVIDVDPGEKTDYRLRLRAGTIGTSDDTVKYLGVRTAEALDLSETRVVSLDLDWNGQQNGSYLTAGIYLSPDMTDGTPGSGPDWLALEYWGVPPGENARLQIARNTGGRLEMLFTEGWPDQQRTGRKIGNQHLELALGPDRLSLKENGEALFSSSTGAGFAKAYLYLQMSSHSNYPAREVYFDNVLVRTAGPD